MEKLFSDRINFYLVFAAGVFIFLLDKNPCNTYAVPILLCTFLISILMLFALWRTFLLVNRVLKEIKDAYHMEVYSESAKAITFPVNANKYLIAVPIVLLLYFGYALARLFL